MKSLIAVAAGVAVLGALGAASYFSGHGLADRALAESPAITATPQAQPRPASDSTNPDPQHYLFEDQIQPGMKGYGLTVMSGGKIEKFQIEVIDVLKDLTPGKNAILVRCAGLGLEHSGVVAGMSGSPVYIQGKMIGAIAFGWGMAKDPIAGVQPIRQMLAIRESSGGGKVGGATPLETGGMRWASHGWWAREAASSPGWAALTTSLGRRVGGKIAPAATDPFDQRPIAENMHTLASPLMVSGASPSTMNLLREQLQGTGLVPMDGGSAGVGADNGEKPLGGIAELKPGEIHLEPGSALALPLVTGDMDLSAIGTVTEVRNGKVYAFGHAFLAEGGTSLPMATGYIYTVMPNLDQSFKMGTSLKPAGTLCMDEQTGVVGDLGPAPATVPVTVKVTNGDDVSTYHYRLSPHPKLTPLILNAVLNQTLVAQRKMPAQFTAHVTGQVTFAGIDGGAPQTVQINNLGATQSFNPALTLLPIVVLSDNPFENLQMTGLSLNATIEHTNRGGTIRSVKVDRLTVSPGDDIHAVAEIERFHKGLVRVPVTVKVPLDAADGEYELMVGTSAMALQTEAQYAPQRFDPQDIGALTTAVDHIVGFRPDHVYASLVLGLSGASVAGQEKSDLPMSRLALYASSRRTDAAPLMRVVTEQADAGVVLGDGGETFSVRVNRRADDRYFSPKSAADQQGGLDHGPGIQMSTQPGGSSD